MLFAERNPGSEIEPIPRWTTPTTTTTTTATATARTRDTRSRNLPSLNSLWVGKSGYLCLKMRMEPGDSWHFISAWLLSNHKRRDDSTPYSKYTVYT